MTEPLLIRVRNALARVKRPDGRDIVTSGAVQGLTADEAGRVQFALEIAPGEKRAAENMLSMAKGVAADVDGVQSVSAVATAHSTAPTTARRPQAGGHDNPLGMRRAQEEQPEILPDIKHIIAVASGKGGVGKSTMAANLAVALARAGHNVGFLDADVYGPSAPTLFGVSGKPDIVDGKIQPARAHGVSVMSIGFLVDPEQAIAWRGPMVTGALKQMMRDVDWSGVDILIIDTPPGTGDAHLSLIQTKRLSGAVIVSTPQEMALADVRRGVELFRKTNVPIVGVLENMAWLETAGGEKSYLFGQGGAEKAAEALGAPFLGAMPIFPDLRIASDAGSPLAAQNHPATDNFNALAEKVVAFIDS